MFKTLKLLLLCVMTFQSLVFCQSASAAPVNTLENIETPIYSAEQLWEFGRKYEFGNGVSKNYALAREYYKKAINAGSLQAMRNLALMYQSGKGVDIDVFNAESLLKRAIESGFNSALLDLGRLYMDSTLPIFDKSQALHQFERAIESQVPSAIESMLELFSDEDREFFVESQFSSEVAYDLANHYFSVNKTVSCEWYLIALKLGHEDAYQDVMPCVRDELYPDKPYVNQIEVARQWSISQGWDPDSLVGEYYYYGLNVEKNKSLSEKYFLLAHNNTGDDIAQYKLGLLYVSGEGVKQDFHRARYFFELASEQGLSVADYELAKIYLDGLGVSQDHQAAYALAKRAAEYQDHPSTAMLYATMTRDGVGTHANPRLAIDWFNKAIEQGAFEAKCELAKLLGEYSQTEQEAARAKRLAYHCESNTEDGISQLFTNE